MEKEGRKEGMNEEQRKVGRSNLFVFLKKKIKNKKKNPCKDLGKSLLLFPFSDLVAL